MAQLRFHHDAPLMGIGHHLLGQGYIVLKGLLRSVDHDGGKAQIEGLFDKINIRPMIQMEDNRHIHRIRIVVADGRSLFQR